MVNRQPYAGEGAKPLGKVFLTVNGYQLALLQRRSYPIRAGKLFSEPKSWGDARVVQPVTERFHPHPPLDDLPFAISDEDAVVGLGK